MLGKASEISMEEINVRDWNEWKAERPTVDILSVQHTMFDGGCIFALIIYKEATT